MTRLKTFTMLVLLACASAAPGCNGKKAAKERSAAAQDASTKRRMSPKARAAEEALLWDASVQKIEELIREAEGKGDTAAVDELRQKLKVSQDGAAQARRRIQAIEAAEAAARRNDSGSATPP